MTRTINHLMEFLRPLSFIIISFLPIFKRAVLKVGIFGIMAASLNTAGFFVLIPVLKGIATENSDLEFLGLKFSAIPEILTTLMLIALSFVAVGLYLRYLIQKSALNIMKKTSEEAAVRSLIQIPSLNMGRITRRTIATMCGRVAYSCGFVMRQLSIGLADLLQLVVFTTALLWINPFLTLSLIVPAMIILVIYTRSIANITNAAAIGRDNGIQLREETGAIASILNSGTTNEKILRNKVDQIFTEGAHGTTLSSRINIRLEIQKGPMIVEALFPMALIMFMLLTFSTENWRQHSGYVVVYILILRVVIGLSQKLSGLIISTGHFHPDISCYEEFMRNGDLKKCRFDSGIDADDSY